MTRRTIACALMAMLLAGCSAGGVDDATTSNPPPGAGSASTAASDPVEALYFVGAYRLSMTCASTPQEGGSTLVYLHGLGGAGGDWGFLHRSPSGPGCVPTTGSSSGAATPCPAVTRDQAASATSMHFPTPPAYHRPTS